METINEIIDVSKKLVQFESIKEKPEEIKKCLEYIKEYFSESKYVIEEFIDNNKHSLVISYNNKNNDSKNPEIMLNGHIDVVEGDKEQFIPLVENRKLIGRGALDMKTGVAGFMVLMKQFSETMPNMSLMIVSDEEIGGLNGTGFLTKKGYLGKFVIASEPNKTNNAKKLNITIGHKGTFWLKIKTKGKSAHGSLIWDGENAIEKLIELYPKIKGLFEESKDDDSWNSTINLGTISGGNSPNKIPDYAEMILDIRFTEKFDTNNFLKKINTLGDFDIEIIENFPLLVNNLDDGIIQKLKSCVESTTKTKCELNKYHGASDLKFFSEKGVPAVIFGPYGENYHGKDEYVDIESVKLFYDSLVLFVEKTTDSKQP